MGKSLLYEFSHNLPILLNFQVYYVILMTAAEEDRSEGIV